MSNIIYYVISTVCMCFMLYISYNISLNVSEQMEFVGWLRPTDDDDKTLFLWFNRQNSTFHISSEAIPNCFYLLEESIKHLDTIKIEGHYYVVIISRSTL